MRIFLYHHTNPKGKIFTDEGEYRAALASGWVEAPWLVESIEDKPAEVLPLTDMPITKEDIIANPVPVKKTSQKKKTGWPKGVKRGNRKDSKRPVKSSPD